MTEKRQPMPSGSRLGVPWLLAGVGAVLLAGVVGVATGPVSIPIGQVVRELLDRLPLISMDSSLSATEQAIVWDIRAPRVVLGLLVGALLAGSGAAYQGVFRNPLADPYLLGIAAGAGAVYVFVRDTLTNTWSQQAYLKASNANTNDRFGDSVAVSGDTVVVGANGEDGDAGSTAGAPNDNAASAGAAYVFVRDTATNTWSQQAYLKASNADTDDRFGGSIAVSGDTVVVGANYEDGDAASTASTPNDIATDAGAAYVFDLDQF